MRKLLAPRYWPDWAGLGLMWCGAHLPFRWQLGVGRLFGRVLGWSLRRHWRIARTNLELCFPDLSPEERERLVGEHFKALGVGLFEIALSWWGRDEQLRPLLHVQGLEHLDNALREGKGVLLLGAHFTTLEIGGRLLALLRPFDVTYRGGEGNPVGEQMRLQRERLYEMAIPRDDVRSMLRRLKHNKVVWYAPDQGFGRRSRVYAPFFGVPAATNPATSRFAAISGARVVPFFVRRRSTDDGYDVMILPAMEQFPSNDLEKDAARVNAVFEEMIRSAPEQYLWVHKRFKKPPPGHAHPY